MSDDRHEAYRAMFTRTRIKEMLEKIHHADVPFFIQECIQLALDINSDPHYEGYHTVRDIVQRAYKKYEKEEIK